MSQQFLGEVSGQVAQRDIINIHHSAIEENDDPMVPAQQSRLHELIDAIVSFSNEERKYLWRRVHAKVGVKSVNQITLQKFYVVEQFLLEELEIAKESKEKRRLVSLILKATQDYSCADICDSYTLSQFGTSHLNSLSRAELTATYQYVLNKIEVMTSHTHSSKYQAAVLTIKRSPLIICITFLLGMSFGLIISN